MNTCMFSNQDAVDCKMIKFTSFFFTVVELKNYIPVHVLVMLAKHQMMLFWSGINIT